MSETNGSGALLRLAGINTYYGQMHILQDADLQVEGELVCLLGGNASGKSTTLKTVLGIVRPRTGTVTSTARTSPDGRRATGSGRAWRSFPRTVVFGPMTVLENLQMGVPPRGRRPGGLRARVRALPAAVRAALTARRDASGGEQQMVAMGRALMARPKLMLMDEPSMGLAPILVERSFEIIKQVHDAGVAMLIVEQNANVSLSIADRGYVLDGSCRARRKASDLIQHEELRQGLPWPSRCPRRLHARHVGSGRVPDLRAHGVRELVLAGGALEPRPGGGRGVARRLGRERRRVGVLGGTERGGESCLRRPCARRA